ncbi:MAG: M48 family metalloprotease [Isosphaeraceae bacterium]|nr:M48 family metalloprotease [Isosphaeraceae bacterium]
MCCPGCGETYRARRRDSSSELPVHRAPEPPPASSFALFWRGVALRCLEGLFYTGTALGSVCLLAFGGVFRVGKGWLRDEVAGWSDIVATLGGVWVVTETRDPDADIGPMLARVDAPSLFTAVDEVARRLNVKSPGQIRVTYLPCCGVVAWEGSRALILGLPLLRVLTHAELRAILAHELAHLARGDATRAARSARFVEGLGRALERSENHTHGPLGALASVCHRWSSQLIGPIARGQEARADRFAAAIAGGSAAASALVKVALVQPLFKEVLEHYDPTDPDAPNLYAFFRAFWYRLPPEVHTAMRLQALTNTDESNDPAHPPLPDRLALLQAYPDPATPNGDGHPATTYLGDLESLELMLHNRLFALPAVEPSVFHKART